jgi:hypothetical protein
MPYYPCLAWSQEHSNRLACSSTGMDSPRTARLCASKATRIAKTSKPAKPQRFRLGPIKLPTRNVQHVLTAGIMPENTSIPLASSSQHAASPDGSLPLHAVHAPGDGLQQSRGCGVLTMAGHQDGHSLEPSILSPLEGAACLDRSVTQTLEPLHTGTTAEQELLPCAPLSGLESVSNSGAQRSDVEPGASAGQELGLANVYTMAAPFAAQHGRSDSRCTEDLACILVTPPRESDAMSPDGEFMRQHGSTSLEACVHTAPSHGSERVGSPLPQLAYQQEDSKHSLAFQPQAATIKSCSLADLGMDRLQSPDSPEHPTRAQSSSQAAEDFLSDACRAETVQALQDAASGPVQQITSDGDLVSGSLECASSNVLLQWLHQCDSAAAGGFDSHLLEFSPLSRCLDERDATPSGTRAASGCGATLHMPRMLAMPCKDCDASALLDMTACTADFSSRQVAGASSTFTMPSMDELHQQTGMQPWHLTSTNIQDASHLSPFPEAGARELRSDHIDGVDCPVAPGNSQLGYLPEGSYRLHTEHGSMLQHSKGPAESVLRTHACVQQQLSLSAERSCEHGSDWNHQDCAEGDDIADWLRVSLQGGADIEGDEWTLQEAAIARVDLGLWADTSCEAPVDTQSWLISAVPDSVSIHRPEEALPASLRCPSKVQPAHTGTASDQDFMARFRYHANGARAKRAAHLAKEAHKAAACALAASLHAAVDDESNSHHSVRMLAIGSWVTRPNSKARGCRQPQMAEANSEPCTSKTGSTTGCAEARAAAGLTPASSTPPRAPAPPFRKVPECLPVSWLMPGLQQDFGIGAVSGEDEFILRAQAQEAPAAANIHMNALTGSEGVEAISARQPVGSNSRVQVPGKALDTSTACPNQVVDRCRSANARGLSADLTGVSKTEHGVMLTSLPIKPITASWTSRLAGCKEKACGGSAAAHSVKSPRVASIASQMSRPFYAQHDALEHAGSAGQSVINQPMGTCNKH